MHLFKKYYKTETHPPKMKEILYKPIPKKLKGQYWVECLIRNKNVY